MESEPLDHARGSPSRLFSFYYYLLFGCACLHYFAGLSLVVGEQGLQFVTTHGLLVVVVSLCCRAWALGHEGLEVSSTQASCLVESSNIFLSIGRWDSYPLHH